MFRQLQIIALNDVGEEAIRKLVEDDAKESPLHKAKVAEQFELSILSHKPLIYSATVKDGLIKALEKMAKRIGKYIKLRNDTNVDNFMLEMKNTAITRMRKNGAVLKMDYIVKLIDDDEISDKPLSSSVIDDKIVHAQ